MHSTPPVAPRMACRSGSGATAAACNGAWSDDSHPPRVELFPFRFRDPLSGRWIRARYVATRDEIAARYAESQITGPAEIRASGVGSFSPFRRPTADELLQLDDSPTVADVERLDAIERFLALLFLRRYVAWCARQRRFAAMEGAALFYRRVAITCKSLT